MREDDYSVSAIDGDFPWFMSECKFCKHLISRSDCTCKAFPNGIPEKFYFGHNTVVHTDVEQGQVGDYVFTDLCQK